MYKRNEKNLSSRLNNRIEIYRRIEIKENIGITFQSKLLKKVWAEITPLKGKINKEEADTISSTIKFKIIIRKTDIKTSDYIMFKGLKYEVDYIIPDYKDNSCLEIYTSIKDR